MKCILSPSILSADFTVLGEQIHQTEEAGAAYLHYDVMDGIFVPSISFGMPVLKSIKKATNQFMDVHLMITEPIRYIDEFVASGADLITIHYEACKDVRATIQKIKEAGVKVGISICPETPAEVRHICKSYLLTDLCHLHIGITQKLLRLFHPNHTYKAVQVHTSLFFKNKAEIARRQIHLLRQCLKT